MYNVRTFVGALPLDIEIAINHWLKVCPDVRVQHIHYQHFPNNCSALVEFIIVKNGYYTPKGQNQTNGVESRTTSE